MNKIELKNFNRIYMLKLYLKRIILIQDILLEYTEISDKELVKRAKSFIKLYLNCLNDTK